MNLLKFMVGCTLSALFSLLVIQSNAFGQAPAQEAAAEWTLMFYMDADNDLEGAQMKDLDEMMAIGSNAKVNIIVLADRNVKGENDDEDKRKYTNRTVGGLKNWTTAKLMVVEKGKLRQLADWGEVNMGDPATLKKFVKSVSAQFPAKRFGLIFGDHGEGWIGIVGDESADGNSLDTVELQAALKDITALTGRLELIGFDACLMANFEAAKAIAPYGKAMVASEELEPGSGWHYTPLLRNLSQNPAIDGFALGKIIVDTFHAFYLGAAQGKRDQTVTLGVIDLTKIPALETAISDLGVRSRAFMKSSGRATWNKTAEARSNTETYGGSDGGEEGDGGDFFDIVDYAGKIKLQKPDADTIRSANTAIAAVKAAVTYKINGSARPGSSGLSIYFPREKETLVETAYALTPFSVSGKWFPFIGEFASLQEADEEAPQVRNVKATDKDIAKADVVTVSAEIIADDLEDATFVLAESNADQQIIIGAIPAEPDENGILSEEWDSTWFTIGNEDKELICPITDFEELADAADVYLVEVPAQIRFKGGKQWRDITMYFVLDFNQNDVIGEFVYAFEFKGNRAREVFLDPGDAVRPVYLSIDNDGNEDLVAATDEADIIQIKTSDGVAVGRADVAAGKYLIGFTATDYAGNTAEAFTEVTIE